MAKLNLDFDPAFGSRLEKLRAAAEAAGIPSHLISGVRTLEDQKQLYANMLAGRAGKPLPFPDRGAVRVAAVPGTSPHEKGVASDLLSDDPKLQAKLDAMAQQFGLQTVAGDPGHLQLGTQPNAPVAPIAGALAAASPYGNPFVDALANTESNNRNIPSTVDKDYAGQPGSKSQGFFQIDTPTWLQFAAKAGIDTTKFPNAMSAPPEVQAQVVQFIPFGRFGPRTQTMLGKQFGTLDKKLTVGELAQQYGKAGPMDPSAVARGSTVNPAIGAIADAKPAEVEPSWYSKFVNPGVDAQGKPIDSPMQKMASALLNSPETMRRREEEQAPDTKMGPPPGARNTSTMGGALLPAMQQTYGQTLNSFQQPLAWNAAPPRAPQMPASGFQGGWGPQTPGFTLNSIQGLGYGFDPGLGVGYGVG